MKTEIKNNFIKLLIALSKFKQEGFSGTGLILYDNLQAISNYHCNLVNEEQIIPSLKLGTDRLITYLAEISHYQHPYHDGFHFINDQGVLTHVAQFFSPPISKSIPNIQGQGARTFCSTCGSKVKGVLMVGSVSSTRNIYLFEKGRLVNNQLDFF